jgi:TPR repeat protein
MNRIWLAVGGAGVLVSGLVAGAVLLGSDRGTPSADYVETTMVDAEAAFSNADYERVAEILEGLAERDVPLAQYRLGLMYLEGQGVVRSEESAMDWLSRAVELDYVDAVPPLATLYLQRGEDAATLEDGVEWYQRAADLDQAEAQAILGSYYYTGTAVEQDVRRGVRLLTLAGDGGDPRAQSNLGYAYATGTGVDQNDEEAFRWYLAAAENGLVRAQAAIGLFYEIGRGTEVDIPESVRWYLNAFDGGASSVGRRLGGLMVANVVQARNEEEASGWAAQAAQDGVEGALEWMEAAAEAGNRHALAQLADFYDAGEVVPQNSSLALTYYQRAAEAGSPQAQLALSGRYATGDGVEQDYVQAHVWANLAAAAGVEGASDERTLFAQFLTPEQLATAQARATQWREAHREN